jgi:hypothetical protein
MPNGTTTRFFLNPLPVERQWIPQARSAILVTDDNACIHNAISPAPAAAAIWTSVHELRVMLYDTIQSKTVGAGSD